MTYGMNSNPSFGKERIPSGYKKGTLQTFDPNQMKLYESLFSHVSPDSYLSKLASGDQSFFEQMEAPAHRQFQANLGQLGSRFSGMGLGGAKSSGFQNTATAASSNFAQDLASKRQDLQRQAIQDLMGMGQSLLSQRPYEQFLVQKPQKQSFSSMLGYGLGKSLPGLFGGGGDFLSQLFGLGG